MLEFSGYSGLFIAALAAATVLPMQSEALLVGLVLSEQYSVPLLLVVASLGNVLGSIINALLGRYIEHFRHKSWFPVNEDKLKRAQNFYHRYGRWSLLLSWVPIIGDPITVFAGVMREPWWSFVLLVSIAKVGRYLVLVFSVQGWMG
ncbi:MAG: DedA family protein [Gammaproteobacteria bacterium]|nr:MAG: DedA family protein [Gammaproteobacteria bacterium]